MGAFLNPNNELFINQVNSEIYVDKSEIILELNKQMHNFDDRFVCISRARRFGKTMIANLIAAYYSKNSNSRTVFEKLKLSKHQKWDIHLNSLNVIKIDLNGIYSSTEDKSLVISNLKQKLIIDLKEAFPSVNIEESTSVADAIYNIYHSLSEYFVVIIDEYDLLIRENVPIKIRQEYIDFLNSIFKNDNINSAIKLAYITGILPIIRERAQSKLNNFREFTMVNPRNFASFFGFTENEVKDLCSKYHRDYKRCQDMYDGYVFPNVGHIFNPNSVAQSIKNGDYESYWTPTSSYEAITDYIDCNIDGIQDDLRTMLEGGEVLVETSKYKNNVELFKSKDQVFTYLTHLGYLAIDSTRQPLRCRIPNGEIKMEWFVALEEANGFASIKELILPSKKVVEATLLGKANDVAKHLDTFHANYSSSLTFNQESALQSAILMAYFYARRNYMVFPELPAGLGFADVAFIPINSGYPAIIVELKRDATPQQAIEQIKTRNYAEAFANHPGRGVLLVGITYDTKNKKHQCLIEEAEDFKTIWN
ncbi:MAG: AAA family ATPase [Marinilabiliaceae bacterium]